MCTLTRIRPQCKTSLDSNLVFHIEATLTLYSFFFSFIFFSQACILLLFLRNVDKCSVRSLSNQNAVGDLIQAQSTSMRPSLKWAKNRRRAIKRANVLLGSWVSKLSIFKSAQFFVSPKHKDSPQNAKEARDSSIHKEKKWAQENKRGQKQADILTLKITLIIWYYYPQCFWLVLPLPVMNKWRTLYALGWAKPTSDSLSASVSSDLISCKPFYLQFLLF